MIHYIIISIIFMYNLSYEIKIKYFNYVLRLISRLICDLLENK